MKITGHTRVFGLIGHPVRHSLSPEMHNRLFEQLGVDAIYVAFDVHPDRGAGVADAIRVLELVGVNLTVPFKADILPHLDRVTRAAEEARSCNVVIHHEGFLTGYNTDGEGFARGYEEAFGPLPRGGRAMVLGAGGAGRAVAAALADRGLAAIDLLNRDPERARTSAEHLAAYFPGARFAARSLSADVFAALAPGADVIVNCTGGGAAATIAGFDVGALDPHAVWCDINYWMPDPPQLDACRRRGLRVQGGLPMLIHQGALSFELFTGLPVDPAQLRANLG